VKRYEGLFILETAGKEEGIKDAIDKISAEITSLGGKVETVQKMEKRSFSRVANKKHNAGFYVNIIFEGQPNLVDQLKHRFAMNAEIFRVLFTNAPAPEPAAPTALEPQPEAEAPVASPEIPVEQPRELPPLAPSIAATSLDSFSLDDATAGQVHFTLEGAEIAPVEVAHSAPAEEAPPTEIAPPEPAPEAVSTEIASPEAPPEAAPAEPPAEVAAPPPAFDWDLIYTVVHKVVVKMSPPALPMQAVEEMARQLADEIATEISSESSQPPA